MESSMTNRSFDFLRPDRVARIQILRPATFVIALLITPLTGCNDGAEAQSERAKFVRTELVQSRETSASRTLTGEVRPRFQAELSFRVSGRVTERLVDVGTHVDAGDTLARLDPIEQQADLEAAILSAKAVEAQLRVAEATFDRQSSLLASGFTTRIAYDQATEGFRSAQSALQMANAQLRTAQERLAYTELRAGAAGVITARSLEVGQVVQSAQTVFTLAQDGERDAVFEVPQSFFVGTIESGHVRLTLLSDPRVTASGLVREVSPTVDPKRSTVHVKVAIHNPPPAMTLASAVVGTVSVKAAPQTSLPWTALMALGSKPAVWIIDPSTSKASLKPVKIDRYEAGLVMLNSGLEIGDRVVVDGGKLLSPGQLVSYHED